MRNQIKVILGCLVIPIAVFGQALSGSVVDADTGSGIAGATVNLFRIPAELSQRSVLYRGESDSTGHYTVSVSPGSYMVCFQAGTPYLDPCQWGTPPVAAVANGARTLDVRLVRGTPFIIRLHDKNRWLMRAEELRGDAVLPFIVTTTGRRFIVPLAFDNGRVRDYAVYLPRDEAITVVLNSAKVNLEDDKAVRLNGKDVSARVGGLNAAKGSSVGKRFGPAPDATFLHVNVVGNRDQ